MGALRQNPYLRDEVELWEQVDAGVLIPDRPADLLPLPLPLAGGSYADFRQAEAAAQAADRIRAAYSDRYAGLAAALAAASEVKKKEAEVIAAGSAPEGFVTLGAGTAPGTSTTSPLSPEAFATLLAGVENADDYYAAMQAIYAGMSPGLVYDPVIRAQVAASLDAELPGWRDLPGRAMLLLQQAEADWLDEHRIDYSGAAINYAKAVEITIRTWLFEPFRAAGYTDRDVVNDKAFKPYMRGERELTLGNYPFLFSSREAAFRQHVVTIYPDADRRLFDGGAGVLAYLGPDEIARRNGAAHEQMFSREEALAARQWSLAILGLMLGV